VLWMSEKGGHLEGGIGYSWGDDYSLELSKSHNAFFKHFNPTFTCTWSIIRILIPLLP
jgi:hypothetical protein